MNTAEKRRRKKTGHDEKVNVNNDKVVFRDDAGLKKDTSLSISRWMSVRMFKTQKTTSSVQTD